MIIHLGSLLGFYIVSSALVIVASKLQWTHHTFKLFPGAPLTGLRQRESDSISFLQRNSLYLSLTWLFCDILKVGDEPSLVELVPKPLSMPYIVCLLLPWNKGKGLCHILFCPSLWAV